MGIKFTSEEIVYLIDTVKAHLEKERKEHLYLLGGVQQGLDTPHTKSYIENCINNIKFLDSLLAKLTSIE